MKFLACKDNVLKRTVFSTGSFRFIADRTGLHIDSTQLHIKNQDELQEFARQLSVAWGEYWRWRVEDKDEPKQGA